MPRTFTRPKGETYAPLLDNGKLTLGLQLHAGLLMPLSPIGRRLFGTPAASSAESPAAAAEQPESCISDRFFLGGPGSFWGFH